MDLKGTLRPGRSGVPARTDVRDGADAHGWTVGLEDSGSGGARFGFIGVERQRGWERPIPLAPHVSGMSRDRTRTRERSGSSVADGDAATDFDVGLGEESGGESRRPADEEDGGLRDRAASRAATVFSPRHFLFALALSGGGMIAANAFVPLPGSGLLGVFLAAFVFGLVLEQRRYLEAVAAGGLVAGVSFLFDFLVFTFLGGLGVAPALLGAALGAVVGLAGTYFGRDLREGLTREVP